MIEGSWATVHGQFVSSGYLFYSVAYGLTYLSVFLLLSIVLINRREFI